MFANTTNFSVHDNASAVEDRHITGAGVLPFMISEVGAVHFLLGRERYVQNWKGSHRWSAFEGGRKGEHEPPIANATREFREETCGVLPADSIEEDLAQGDYAMRIALTTTLPHRRSHVTFVTQFSWEPAVVCKFAEQRKTLLAVQTLTEEIDTCASRFPPKYPFLREGDRVSTGDADVVVVAVDAVTLHNSALHLRFECALDSDAHENNHATNTTLCIVYTTSAVTEEMISYQKWFSMRRHATRFVKTLPITGDSFLAANVRATFAPNGLVTSLWLNPDLREKASIKLWPIGDLVRAVQDSASEDLFRPYFLVVLKQVLLGFTRPWPPPLPLANGSGQTDAAALSPPGLGTDRAARDAAGGRSSGGTPPASHPDNEDTATGTHTRTLSPGRAERARGSE